MKICFGLIIRHWRIAGRMFAMENSSPVHTTKSRYRFGSGFFVFVRFVLHSLQKRRPFYRSLNMEKLLEEILKLPVGERIELAKDIWDSIPQDESNDELYEKTRRIVDVRSAEYEAIPGDGILWNEWNEQHKI